MSDLINGRTPEEIKRILRWINFDCADHECDSCPNEDICSLQNDNEQVLAKNALDLIERLEAERDAALAKVPRWIKLTEESKPRDTGFYVVLVTKHGLRKRVCFYDSTADDWWLRGDCVNGFVTHWVSGLPEPPEEE